MFQDSKKLHCGRITMSGFLSHVLTGPIKCQSLEDVCCPVGKQRGVYEN